MFRFRKLLGALALACAASSAAAQVYPNKAVKIVVPASAGGVTDLLARAIADKLGAMWKQPVIVENRSGANQIIGADFVAKAAPDGYTLFVSDSSTFEINPHLYKKLPYDGIRDFTPITILGAASPVIVVNAALPVNNMEELLALAKSKPEALHYGSMGAGSYAHVSMEDLKRRAGIEMVHVPYKGAAPATSDLVSGQIQVALGNISGYQPFVKSGKLRIIAAATAHRLKGYPELPTVAESGVRGFETTTWFGLVGPAKMDEKLVAKIYRDVAQVIEAPEFESQVLAANGIEPVKITPVAFGERMKKELATWKVLVQQSGASLD